MEKVIELVEDKLLAVKQYENLGFGLKFRVSILTDILKDLKNAK